MFFFSLKVSSSIFGLVSRGLLIKDLGELINNSDEPVKINLNQLESASDLDGSEHRQEVTSNRPVRRVLFDQRVELFYFRGQHCSPLGTSGQNLGDHPCFRAAIS